MLEERRVQKAKISLMRSEKFALFAGVLMVGKTYVDDDVPTACTNGRDERYGRAFVKKLRDPELAFVVAHEAMHKAYRHLSVWRKLHDEDPRLANAACDYVINLELKDLDPEGKLISMPTYKDGEKRGQVMGLVDEKYRGMNSKQVFDLLKQEFDSDDGGDGFDDHDWDGAKELSEEDKEKLARDIDQAMRQGLMAQQKMAGKGTGGMSRELNDLLQPKIDWREALREFVKATCRAKDKSSWRRVNRRFLSGDVYMPSLIGEKVGQIVVAVDTSGSVGGAELAKFLSEVKGIADQVTPEKVHLLYWGSSVVAHEEYGESDMGNLVNSTRPKDGGGTSPSCITEYMEKERIEPECCIVLTDGYVGDDWGGTWPSPVLWVIVGDNEVMAPVGKTVHVKD